MKQAENRKSAARDRTESNMRRAAALLSEMLAHTVAETRRLQKQQEKALGRHYEDRTELTQAYQAGEMKELTVLLKDIAAVTKALDERGGQADQEQQAGVVVLPQVKLPPEGEEGADEESH